MEELHKKSDVIQGAFLDFYAPPDQQMIVFRMILIPPIQILVESSVETLQMLLHINNGPMEISKRLRKENNVPWEACLLVVDQDKILLLYYQ